MYRRSWESGERGLGSLQRSATGLKLGRFLAIS